MSAGCAFGVEGPAPKDAREQVPFLKAVRELGADFIVCQFTPEINGPRAREKSWIGLEGTAQGFGDFAKACREAGLYFLANEETTNYCVEGDFPDKAGRDVLAHPDGTHRFDISGELLAETAQLPEFRGVLYDEPEHGQMRREVNTNGGGDSARSGRVHPYFAATDGMSLPEACEAVYRSARAVAEEYRKAGVEMLTEHVFPVMFHTFARAGVTACPKFMKEGVDPVWAAIALGAARQYGTGFSVAPDLWGVPSFGFAESGFPGHSPEELRCALLYAYWMGAERIFVENVLSDFISTPSGLLERVGDGAAARFEPTEYGEVYRWFAREYVPAHPRPCDWRDLRPEVAVVRFPDSCWGQAESWLPDALYGAENLKTTSQTAAWFGLWHLLTHGKVHADGLSYHGKSYKDMKHDFFCPLRGVVVYDHLAGAKQLEDVKLVFLTGEEVSPPTLEAVGDFVRRGGLCVALPHLVPTGKAGQFDDGAGRWLLTEDFQTAEVREAVAPYLGSPDEIRYRFGERLLTVRREGDDGNAIRICLDEERVW